MHSAKDKELVFRVSVWADAIRALHRYTTSFTDEFGSWASEEELQARDVILGWLGNIEHIMIKHYRDALTEQLDSWDYKQEEKA